MIESISLWIISIWLSIFWWIQDYNEIVRIEEERKIAIEEQRLLELSKIKHVKTPESVKSVYYTAWALNYWPKRKNLFYLLDNKEINSVVIDIKTISGYTNFKMPDEHFWTIKPSSNNLIKDIKSELELLHESDTYIIGRIVVFKDNLVTQKRPDLAIQKAGTNKVWEDYAWNTYADAGSQEIWDYHIALAKTAYEMWFDEINFDYVRFPTDGKITEAYYPHSHETILTNPKWWKIKVLDSFWEYMNKNIKEYNSDIIISADVFWLVTNNDLFQIGQNLESFLLYFDYVAPMIYPSHYGVGFLWYKQPDNHPYEIFQYAINESNNKINALNKEIKLAQEENRSISILWKFDAKKSNISKVSEIKPTNVRPWLQGFSCTRCPGATRYNTTKFRKQIQAINDVWITSWFVWSAGSNYYPEWYKK